MLDVDLRLALAAEAQRGFLTIDDCRRAGASAAARQRRLDAGLLVVRHEGVYRHAAHPPTFDGEVLAATLAAGPLAAASGHSAMRLLGARGEWSDVPEITVAGTELLALAGVHVRRIDRLDPADISRRDGIPVLSPPLALLLLGAVASRWKVETAVHDLVFQRLTTRSRLIDVLVRYGGRGRRGTAALRRAVRGLDPDGAATQTNLELRLVRLIREHGLPEPRLQHRVVDRDGRQRRLDVAWPEAMLDVETDGDRWHLTPGDRAADRRRDAALAGLGWSVLRLNSADVDVHATQTVARILASLSGSRRVAV